MKPQAITIRGARTHNLKNIDVDLPHNHLVVITGVSGSGKSSLAFDTLYAEGQRRYVESLSAYARQFLDRMSRPDVDEIKGLAPAVAIEQKNPIRSSRSTVGTATEILDYLRLLYSRIGRTFCPSCGQPVRKDSVADVLSDLQALPVGTKVVLTFPFCESDREAAAAFLRESGFLRLWKNGDIVALSDAAIIPNECLNVVMDRLILKPEMQTRLADSVEQAFHHGHGVMQTHVLGGDSRRYSQDFACSRCQQTFIEPQPRLFSFNNPFGACPICKGFGDIIHIDRQRVIPDPSRSLAADCIVPWSTPAHRELRDLLLQEAPKRGIDIHAPYAELSDEQREWVWQGSDPYPGLDRFFEWLESKKYKISVRVFLSRYRGYVPCTACHGSRLRPEAEQVRIGGLSIAQSCRLDIRSARRFFADLPLSEQERAISGQIFDELINRLTTLDEIGLDYLTLDRRTFTLSGGEFQRINLATALGSQLVGALYILDEPTIGLHPRDTRNLLNILQKLRKIGNTVVVVEHDREIIENADYLIDIGPLAGREGGSLLFSGTPSAIADHPTSLTGAYLSGKKHIAVPAQRRPSQGPAITVHKAREHNLQSITVSFPLGVLVAVTGVSGSGKSTLVHEVLYRGLARQRGDSQRPGGLCSGISGGEAIDEIALVDQSPIGKSPRSNPATYLKAFDAIRVLFAESRQARVLGLKPGDFSFNTAGGRCETCQGAGAVKVEMQFLADLYLECEDCGGKRYKRSLLQVHFRGKNIAEVLEMTVNEAIDFFRDQPGVIHKLQPLRDVGLGYLQLGQASNTLSGGEAQRIKLASHLLQDKNSTHHNLYLFDEPTTGLHFQDVAVLLNALNQLVDQGHSVLVIEHNLDVIKCADWVIDLGPGGGDQGGQLVACGTPESVAADPHSLTGKFLAPILSPLPIDHPPRRKNR